ncbi:MAG: uroporphyrinogen-III C-methyltransferase [Gemmataceae bacterium]
MARNVDVTIDTASTLLVDDNRNAVPSPDQRVPSSGSPGVIPRPIPGEPFGVSIVRLSILPNWAPVLPQTNSAETIAPGEVVLLGAGPGAADLITVRGMRLLQVADAICYDALIGTEILEYARAEALRIPVGKRGYCIGATHQDTIHETLVQLAQAGHRVVRLKGGDPGIFGRGGEEAEHLTAHGVAWRIVPGITTALAAAAEARLPLTHRAVGPAVTFLTGHFDPSSDSCPHDWAALARVGTLVVYMGTRHLPAILQKLIAGGLTPTTPIAILTRATFPDQTMTFATVAELAAAPAWATTPTVAIIGEVVARRDGFLGELLTELPHLES